MSEFWRGYASINDDVRHTYERVFYGRELTSDLSPAHMPGIGREAPPGGIHGTAAVDAPPDAFKPADAGRDLYGAEPSLAEREATAAAYTHAANAPGIRAEIDRSDGVNPYPWANAPDLQPRSGIEPAGAPKIEAAPIEAPKIEAPAIQPPDHGGLSAEQAAFYGSIWGDQASQGPQIEAPKIEAPAIEPPQQEPQLGY